MKPPLNTNSAPQNGCKKYNNTTLVLVNTLTMFANLGSNPANDP